MFKRACGRAAAILLVALLIVNAGQVFAYPAPKADILHELTAAIPAANEFGGGRGGGGFFGGGHGGFFGGGHGGFFGGGHGGFFGGGHGGFSNRYQPPRSPGFDGRSKLSTRPGRAEPPHDLGFRPKSPHPIESHPWRPRHQEAGTTKGYSCKSGTCGSNISGDKSRETPPPRTPRHQEAGTTKGYSCKAGTKSGTCGGNISGDKSRETPPPRTPTGRYPPWPKEDGSRVTRFFGWRHYPLPPRYRGPNDVPIVVPDVPAPVVSARPVVVGGGGAAAAAAIAGFGGSRPPIAPRFSKGSGQQPTSSVAEFLDNKRHRAKELLVEVAADSSDELKQALANQYGVAVRELGVIELIGARIWHLTLLRQQDELATVLGRLLQDSRVITAQPNYVYTPAQGTAQGHSQGQRKAALTPPRSDDLPTGPRVKVAIIDTCVDRDHFEIEGSVQHFLDATTSGSENCEAENHGTAVASLIGGHDQIRGYAQGAELMEVRAFTVTEEEKEVAATSVEIVAALDWSAREGVRVANLSFAGPSDPLVERVLAAAYTGGIVLVGAAGNGGPTSAPLYPAAYPEVIAVTATDGKRELYGAANRGSYIAVSARGVDVIVAHVNNGYGTESGTSFAAATVSGIAALLVKMRPKATPDEIRAALQNTAVSLSGKEKDERFGYGLVNAKAATAFLEASVSQ